MGRDKGLVLLASKPLVAHVVERLAPQCGALAINGPDEFRATAMALGAKLIDEAPFAGRGPLGGIRAGLAWARTGQSESNHLLVAPVDMPFLPLGLVDRLSDGIGGDEAAIASSPDGRTVPVLGLWPLSAIEAIEQALGRGGNLAVRAVLDRIAWRSVEFPADELIDIDDPAALALAEARIAAAPHGP